MSNQTTPAAITENPIILNLTQSYGYILIGAILSCFAWAISCMQLYEDDKIALKLLVLGVWLCDTANEILILISSHSLKLPTVWPVLILKWGSLAELSITQPVLLHRLWVTSIVAFVVQMFFIVRIFRCWLSWQGKTAIYAADSTVGTILLISMECLVVPGPSFDVAFYTPHPTMVHFLYQERRSAFFIKSRRMIHRLIVLTVATGLWTAIAALIDVSLIAAYPHGLQFCIFEFVFGSLYVNSLLANLNARQHVKNADTEFNSIGEDTNGNTLVLRNMSNGRSTAPKGGSSVAIRVDTSHIVDTDYPMDSVKATDAHQTGCTNIARSPLKGHRLCDADQSA
ncbi:hypothetical protein PYCCODRAFT_1421620 [Trametes coccinea BRFM310]|uniref:DUF6534 domain-containing protein n=1 Tax=Trametes coccinea (strain BRFM310) TaxID=1353009 RepID=A0A1Y2J2S3_TRAC3|nr:hypothetical protein PYCCODRAFT_1421620 [Trametes coccinea BRFM310]